MSLFRTAGKKFEETKRAIVGDEDAAYICRSCESSVETDTEYCPHCGEDSVISVD